MPATIDRVRTTDDATVIPLNATVWDNAPVDVKVETLPTVTTPDDAWIAKDSGSVLGGNWDKEIVTRAEEPMYTNVGADHAMLSTDRTVSIAGPATKSAYSPLIELTRHKSEMSINPTPEPAMETVELVVVVERVNTWVN